MSIVDDNRAFHRRIVVPENESWIVAFDGCVVREVDGALAFASGAHSTPFFII
jgi:hypothetical protein